jgi:hypothetical protein
MQRAKFLLPVIMTILMTGLIPGTVGKAAAAGSDVLVSVGSPTTPFPQSWQNTPAVAVDPAHPDVVAAAAIDTIDTAACSSWDDPTSCPFGRIGLAGVYFSFDGGDSWTQPTYTGLTRRGCLSPVDCQLSVDDFSGGLQLGPIGTVPNHYQAGMFPTIDPSVAFGPAPSPTGTFSWENGSRLYHLRRVQLYDQTSPWYQPAFPGVNAIGVSRIDGQPALTQEVVGDQANWMPPVIIRSRNSDDDRLNVGEFGQLSVWADNAASSPNFGHVYACSTSSRNGPDPSGVILDTQIVLDVSVDGGATWEGRGVSRASSRHGARSYCQVRTDSEGTVYLSWNEGFLDDREVVTMTRSFDGGRTFERPRTIASAIHCGTLQEFPIDGVQGSDAFPSASMDIANGAPDGADATDQIVLAVCDGSQGIDATRVFVTTSTDRGETWTDPVDAATSGDRPSQPAIAISPDGEDVYLVYLGFLDPWRESLAGARRVQGVVLHAEAANVASWIVLHRGSIGDGRASSGMSAGGRDVESLGQYQGAAATRDQGILMWTDIRYAERCPAVEAYRQSLVDDPDNPLPTPAPNTDCPPTFGNSDIYAAAVTDPTP